MEEDKRRLEEEYEKHVLKHRDTFIDEWESDGALSILCVGEESKDFEDASNWSIYGHRWREFISYVKDLDAWNQSARPNLFQGCWYWLEISIASDYGSADIWNYYLELFPMAEIQGHGCYFKTLKVRFFGKLHTVDYMDYGRFSPDDQMMRELIIILPSRKPISIQLGYITQAHLCTHLDPDKRNIFKAAAYRISTDKDGKVVWLPPEES